MSRTGWNRRVADAGWAARLGPALLGLAIAAGPGSTIARGQAIPPAGTIPPAAAVELAPVPAGEAGDAVAAAPGVSTGPATPVVPQDVQVVRFQGPEGIVVEVLGPQPEVVPVGDGKGLGTFGLKVGVGYKLRVSNLPDRPGVELFPDDRGRRPPPPARRDRPGQVPDPAS